MGRGWFAATLQPRGCSPQWACEGSISTGAHGTGWPRLTALRQPAGGGGGGGISSQQCHMSEAHISQPTSSGMSRGRQKARASDMRASRSDRATGHSRLDDGVRHTKAQPEKQMKGKEGLG